MNVFNEQHIDFAFGDQILGLPYRAPVGHHAGGLFTQTSNQQWAVVRLVEESFHKFVRRLNRFLPLVRS